MVMEHRQTSGAKDGYRKTEFEGRNKEMVGGVEAGRTELSAVAPSRCLCRCAVIACGEGVQRTVYAESERCGVCEWMRR